LRPSPPWVERFSDEEGNSFRKYRVSGKIGMYPSKKWKNENTSRRYVYDKTSLSVIALIETLQRMWWLPFPAGALHNKRPAAQNPGPLHKNERGRPTKAAPSLSQQRGISSERS
jgi:hypothetical protein